jgi:ATP synthase protein I
LTRGGVVPYVCRDFAGVPADSISRWMRGRKVGECRMAKDDQNNPPSLDDLDARLRAARDGAERSSGQRPPDKSAASPLVGMAMRAGVELVAGVGVGTAAGYGLDKWLDTSPWLLIVFFLVGAAAGMLNAYRAVSGIGMALGYRRGTDDDASGNGRGGE